MSTSDSFDPRVDRYVKNQLSPEEVEEFEIEMLDSPRLQDELEAVLALKGILQAETDLEPVRAVAEPRATYGNKGTNWNQLALAASFALALFSSVMWWKTGNDAATFENQVELLSQPNTNVLRVGIPIMRSAGSQTPDVIVQKPGPGSAMFFEVEVAPSVAERAPLEFQLLNDSDELILRWSATPGLNRHANVLVNSDQVPATRLWLTISSSDGELLERRLLEFR